MDAIKNDPNFGPVKLGKMFNRLPSDQKLAVLNFIKNKNMDQTPLSGIGVEFTEGPYFKQMLERHRSHKPPRKYPETDPMTLMSGLMQIVRKFIGDPEDDDDERKLKSEYSERTGGSGKMGSPFDIKFAKAFQSEGATGTAKLHKNMMSDIEYQTFLDGV